MKDGLTFMDGTVIKYIYWTFMDSSLGSTVVVNELNQLW